MTAEAVLALRTLFPTWDPCPDASGRTWHRGNQISSYILCVILYTSKMARFCFEQGTLATLLISWVIAAGSIPSVTLLASDCRTSIVGSSSISSFSLKAFSLSYLGLVSLVVGEHRKFI
ncbi:hypothetical protein C2G38_2141914 [Gigaspora rosea]|uniref:Uncharacterized protein n=1 Tax=Gigaspora rosea TaxID=44941 RepID=A0A397VHT8_9GLOM|nr:hypothetical protein C2G38_2141914 [Gigaspora rosea]